MADDYERSRDLMLLVQSLKRTVEDRSPRGIGRIGAEDWRRTVLAFEEVRVILRQASRRRERPEPIDLDLMGEAHDKLVAVASDPSLMDVILSMPLRLLPPLRQESIERFRGMSAGDGLFAAIDLAAGLSQPPEQQAFDLTQLADVSRLARMVPEQKIAPAKFGIDHDKIVVVRQHHSVPSDERAAVEAARSHLHTTGKRIVDALSSSNCDRRLIEAIEGLQTALVEPDNVIQLGLANLGCEAICSTAKDELPDALCGMIKGHTAAIGMFVAQFPEWQKFSENAAAVELTARDVEEINRAASQIIAQTEGKPEIADDEVPKTIRAIRSLTLDPATTGRKAAFALLRTVENFVSTVFGYGADFISKTASKTSEELSTAISRTAAGVLMAAALAGASQMTGVTDRIAEAGWIKNAVEIVQRQIAKSE